MEPFQGQLIGEIFVYQLREPDPNDNALWVLSIPIQIYQEEIDELGVDIGWYPYNIEAGFDETGTLVSLDSDNLDIQYFDVGKKKLEDAINNIFNIWSATNYAWQKIPLTELPENVSKAWKLTLKEDENLDIDTILEFQRYPPIKKYLSKKGRY